MASSLKLETRTVHAGGQPDPATGAVAPPIHLSTTFERGRPRRRRSGTSTSATATRRRRASRRRSPRSKAARRRSCSAPAWRRRPRTCRRSRADRTSSCRTTSYYGVRAMAREFLPRWGMEATPVDMTNLDAVRAALRPTTRVIWAESPSNPLMQIARPRGARRDRARRRGALLSRGQHVRDAGGAAAARARRGRRPSLDDQVPRRAQRRAGRRARLRGRRGSFPRRSSTSARSSGPWPRRSTPGSSCAACARSPRGCERHCANALAVARFLADAPGRRGGPLPGARVPSGSCDREAADVRLRRHALAARARRPRRARSARPRASGSSCTRRASAASRA